MTEEPGTRVRAEGRDREAALTVVYPLFDPRGRAAERVRAWTCGQTLERSRYRVVVVTDGSKPEDEREIEQLLGPDDEIVRFPSSVDAALWNAGAAQASTPWLVLAEGHCTADPECLAAVARWIEANPQSRVGNLVIGHPRGYHLAELSDRWFGIIQSSWRDPATWPRVHRAGFAVRAEVFAAVGGFDARLRLFAAPMLSAQLHQRDIAIDSIPEARVVHVDNPDCHQHHVDTFDHARGELDAREYYGMEFCERYFGHSPVWSNRLRYGRAVAAVMARGAGAAAIATRALGWPRGFFRLAVTAIAGNGARRAAERLAVRLAEIGIDRLWLPDGLRWSIFLGAHARAVRLAGLEWANQRVTPSAPPLGETGRWPIETLGPDALVGLHALEEHDGLRFRWSEPIALLRLPPLEGDHAIEIETAGLRADPLDYLTAVCIGGRVLPRPLVAARGGTLRVSLPAPWAARARRGIVLVADPLIPSRSGSADGRALGIPIFSIALERATEHDLELEVARA